MVCMASCGRPFSTCHISCAYIRSASVGSTCAADCGAEYPIAKQRHDRMGVRTDIPLRTPIGKKGTLQASGSSDFFRYRSRPFVRDASCPRECCRTATVRKESVPFRRPPAKLIGPASPQPFRDPQTRYPVSKRVNAGFTVGSDHRKPLRMPTPGLGSSRHSVRLPVSTSTRSVLRVSRDHRQNA